MNQNQKAVPQKIKDFIQYLKTSNIVKLSDHQTQYLYLLSDQRKLPLDKLYTLFNSQVEGLKFEDYRSYILASMDDIVGFTFHPAKPKLVNTSIPNWFDLNTYRSYEPQENHPKINIKLWLEFLSRLFPDQEERHIVCQYLAHIFQRPSERPSWHLLLTSDTGTGKGYLFSEVLRPLLMDQVYQASSYSELTKTHSVAFDGTMLLMLDDPKSMQESTMTQIKSKLSETQVAIERKFEQAKIQLVFTRVILASNEIRPLKLDANERRWFAPNYIKHEIDKSDTQNFISKLDTWLKNGGLDAIYAWLLEYPLDNFNAKNITQTETLKAMIEQSVPMVVEDLKEWLLSNSVFKWSDLQDEFPEVHDNLMRKYLVELGYKQSRPQKDKVKYRVWHPSTMDKTVVKEVFFNSLF